LEGSSQPEAAVIIKFNFIVNNNDDDEDDDGGEDGEDGEEEIFVFHVTH
jgi:hypothetical protein